MKDNSTLQILLGILIVCVVDFLVSSCCIWIISKCFNFIFSWKLAFGVWATLIIIKILFK